jgi:hypothetical protein
MANPVKGEARLSLGDGRVLTLAYDFDAMVEVEEIAGTSFDKVVSSGEGGSPPLKMLRALFAGGLKRHHPDIDLSAAGEMLLSDGPAIATAITAAMTSAMHQSAGAAPGAHPPEGAASPPRGTGTRSSKAGPKRG